METRQFVLLDIDYITKNHIAVIRLFGRLIGENEGSIIALDKSFRPYIYVQPHDMDNCVNDLSELKLLKVEKLQKRDNGLLKDFLKVTLNHPQDIYKLKDKIMELKSVENIREYDIPFYRRYLIDNGLFPMNTIEVEGKVLNSTHSSRGGKCLFEIHGEPKNLESDLEGLNMLSFNIEACNPKGMPQVKEDPIIMVSFSSNQGFQKIFSTKKSSLDFVETLCNEKDLIEKYVNTIQSEDPDIILGYNSDRFDFPYIKERAEKLGVPLKLGVDESYLKITNNGLRNATQIKGRIHIDLYSNMRRNLPLEHHSLKRVYKELFGKNKIDIPGNEVYTCWNDGGEKLEKLFRYSLGDVMAVTEIGEKMLPLSMELTRIVGQPLFDVARMGSGKQVEWYLIRKAFEYGDMAPNKFGNYLRDVVGGYVEEPVKGLHTNIYYFDFRSLYPSIIISKNISPETLVEDDSKECHIAPEFGYKFRKSPQGFIPSVVSEVLENRMRIKSLIAESTDYRERQVLNYQQEAFKRLASTIYGLYNHSTFRWYSIECSEAITAWGRDFLQKTMKRAEKHGFKPVYADTDGFYAILDRD
ncbi:DNA-directed DNA polymerase [Methanobacterium spitsbergense]|uniref:DNA polymerase n=1 Tax=Methanobacterium spitsbergense TaxID=2874285 RepID=A0A8T5UL38_9EURY|nr:DNA-directed DNA polymerase [Methanobacterium spitsbergense]MBZ2164552.1 DNA-directed DNA polymerase [Methanobacterium spitsbergense]